VLARTLPLRDFFLVPSNYAGCRSQLVQRFGELMRKIWNPRNFKGQVLGRISPSRSPPGI
jgi:U4/U6.U5 tri-snRNP-associated protein 2